MALGLILDKCSVHCITLSVSMVEEPKLQLNKFYSRVGLGGPHVHIHISIFPNLQPLKITSPLHPRWPMSIYKYKHTGNPP